MVFYASQKILCKHIKGQPWISGDFTEWKVVAQLKQDIEQNLKLGHIAQAQPRITNSLLDKITQPHFMSLPIHIDPAHFKFVDFPGPQISDQFLSTICYSAPDKVMTFLQEQTSRSCDIAEFF